MNEILKALAVTAEVCGSEFSEPAARAMVLRLNAYPLDVVLKALDRCQIEITGRLSLAAIIARIDDGRPSADEAWSIALSSMDESSTVVTNDEIAEAYGAAKPIFVEGDDVGARMAFRAAYDRIIQRNRAAGVIVKWWASVGSDKALAETVLTQSAAAGRLTNEQVRAALPYSGATVEGFAKTLAIENKGDPVSRDQALQALSKIKQMFGEGGAA